MKTVLVTGASGEIGAAIAKEFAAAGYALALHGAKHIENVNQLAETFKSNGIEAYPVCGDLSDPAACERVWADTEKKLGHIDALVNAAGISLVDFFDTMTPAQWKTLCDTNLSSAVYLSQCASRSMIRQKSGAIVKVSSIWGVSGAAMEVAYSAGQGRYASGSPAHWLGARPVEHHRQCRRTRLYRYQNERPFVRRRKKSAVRGDSPRARRHPGRGRRRRQIFSRKPVHHR